MAGYAFESGQHIVGVVLAGGSSSRMGRDKFRIKFQEPDGPDMLAKSVKLLARYCDDVVVACGARKDISRYNCIWDTVNDIGPIAGLQSTLLATGKTILALACDLPFMDDFTVQRLIRGRTQRPDTAIMTTFRKAKTGLIESLVAIYEPACLPLLNAAIAAGVRRISSAIPQAQRYDILYTDAEALHFLNINRPEDLEVARRMATDRKEKKMKKAIGITYPRALCQSMS